MPSIKIVRRERSIPGVSGEVTAPITATSAPHRATAQLGRTIGDIGSLIQERRERQQIQDRNNQEIDIGTAYDDTQRAFFTDEIQRKGSASYGNMERAEAFRKSSIETFTKDIKDENLKLKIKNRILSRSSALMDKLSGHQAGQRAEVSQSARDKRLSGILKDSYDGLETVEESINSLQETISAQRGTGVLGEEEAVDLIVQGTQEIAEANLDGLINRNPEMAIEEINSGAYDKYLPQDKIEEYDKKAKTLDKAIKKDTVAQQKERERVAKVALEKKQKETGNEFLGLLTDGTLTNELILQSELDPTGENSKEHWIKEIEKRNKKVKKGDEWETTPAVEAGLITRITEDPDSVTAEEITALQGDGLSTQDAKNMLSYKQRRARELLDPVKEQEMKTAVKRLSDAKTSRFFDPADRVNNSKIWAENVNSLQRYVKDHPDEDISLYVDQIMAPVEETWTQHFLDLISFGQPGLEEAREQRQEELKIEAGGVEAIKEGEAIKRSEVESLPSASENTGKTFRDTKTGDRFRSNGESWVKIL